MIKIEGLTKKYLSNHKNVCVALDNVHLVLPETGMVFILGKSGSGKSTLLNLLGALDSFDSGDIVCFSNSLKGFSEKDSEAYRSHLVSFIFQDYHLLDELTVWENITLLSSDSQEGDFFLKQLEAVGIADLKDRYPYELSGGQRQRVAIARALAKNPRIILCDEPTGNLDNATSKQILTTLKELAKDKLVIIVSHNTNDANAYADRIIELADGRVVNDITREDGYCDALIINEDTATIPYHTHLNETDLNTLNNAIQEGRVTKLQVNSAGFEPTTIEYKPVKEKLSMRKIRRENIRTLFRKFFFARTKGMLATIFLTMLMFGVFAVIQSFIQYDPASAIQQAGTETNSVVAIERDYSDFPLNIYDDLSAFEKENTYYLYSQTIWTNVSSGSSWDNGNMFSEMKNFSELFILENYGLLLCDMDYLTDLYAKDGTIPLTAGDIETSYKTGLLITDYFADAIIYHEAAGKTFRYLDHDSLIGVHVPAGVNTSGYICGIIDTGYEEKYKEIFEMYAELKDSEEEITQKEIEELVLKTPACIQFIDDVKMHLGIAYSLNPNYVNDFTLSETSLVRTKNLYLSANGKEECYSSANYVTQLGDHWSKIYPSHFADDEIGISYAMYNKLFGTEYTTKDIGKFDLLPEQTVTITRYQDDSPKKPVVYTKTFKITCLTNNVLCVSENTILFFKQHDWQPSRIYFKDVQDVNAIVQFMDENEYSFISKKQEALRGLNTSLNSFKPLFQLIEYTIILLIASYLILFGVKSIKSSRYQIGVIKALGGNTSDISLIFVLNTLIVGIVASILSTLSAIWILNVANDVLLTSMETSIKLELSHYQIIKVLPNLLAIDGLIMVGISFISALLPVLFLKKIKPVEIIKAKE